MATRPSTSSKSMKKTSARSSAARDESSAACAPSSKPPLPEKASASTSTSSDDRDYLVLAEVLGAHGIRGEVRVRLVTDFPKRRFRRGARVLLARQPYTV